MTGTTVDQIHGEGWASESHSTHYVRYFMGRKYYVIDGHNFMSTKVTLGGNEIFWMKFTRYIAIHTPVYAKVSFRSNSVSMNGPSLTRRAIDAMIPDDIQAIPF